MVWLECRKSQVGLCQGTTKMSVELRSFVDGKVVRPTLAGKGLRAGARSLVLCLRQGYGACTLLAAEQYHTFKNPNS